MRYLITGATGTLGSALTKALLADASTERVIGLSRGEHAQAQLRSWTTDQRLELFIGDVRDRERLEWAMRAQPDVVVHAAALKRVEACEANADEAYKTNVVGTRNVCHTAMLADVPKVLVISTDKAAEPTLVYGKTKAQAEAIAIGQNAWRGSGRTRISVARYGNVLGSAGSVLDVFLERRRTGEPLPITAPEATRFWWSVESAVDFVRWVLRTMAGGEIFIPKLPSARVIDLAKAIAPNAAVRIVGMRAPEKSHEVLLSETESRYAYEVINAYIVLPPTEHWWAPAPPPGAYKVPAGLRFASDTAPMPVEFVEQRCASR